MARLIDDIDRLLRGGFTQTEDLRAGRIDVPAGTLVRAGLALGVTYGVCMGLYAGMRSANPTWLQLAVTAAKVPALFLLTLVVTFPSLYVFSALANSRLQRPDTLRLLLAAVSVNLALLASLGPVTAFFTLCTDSYPFMVFLNVVFFAVSGFVGLSFLRRALRVVFDEVPGPAYVVAAPAGESGTPPVAQAAGRLGEVIRDASPEPPRPAPVRYEPGPRPGGAARTVFGVWLVLYAVVGAQMGWVLRPFVGTPGQPFELFRERDSHFFRALGDTIRGLFQ